VNLLTSLVLVTSCTHYCNISDSTRQRRSCVPTLLV